MDQYFSRLSVNLSKLPRGCLSFQQLCHAIVHCFRKDDVELVEGGVMQAKAVRLPCVWALREWIQPHSRGLKNLHAYHQFEFIRNEEGKCVMRAKQWVGTQWTEPIVVLKSLPTEPPELIKPNYDAVNISQLRKTGEVCPSFSTVTPACIKSTRPGFIQHLMNIWRSHIRGAYTRGGLVIQVALHSALFLLAI